MNIQDKVIVVTGGGTGIGLAIAKELLKYNNRVIITGRRESRLIEAKEANPGLEYFASDVTDEASIGKLKDFIVSQFGGLDILVNNAGIYQHYNIRQPNLELADLEKEISINLMGPIRMIKYFMPLLEASKESAIVNVSSVLAYLPFSNGPVYSATKAALHSFTLSLREQFRGSHIKVIELMPPLVDTDMTDGLDLPKMKPEDLGNTFIKGLKNDKKHIRPGQAKVLYVMSRLIPGFMLKQLNKGS